MNPSTSILQSCFSLLGKKSNIYADEFERFASRDFTRLLKETRKYGMATTIAHQARDFLDVLNRSASAQVPNLIVFQISKKDADELAGQFDCTPPPGEPRREEILTPVSDVLGHLRGRGSHKEPMVNDFVNKYQLLGKSEYNYLFSKANRGISFDKLIQTEEEKERLLQLVQTEFFQMVRETLPILPTHLKLQSDRGMVYDTHYWGDIPQEQEVLQLVYFYLFIPNNRYILRHDRYAFPSEQTQMQQQQQSLLTTLLLHAGDPFGREFKEASQILEELARERFTAIRQEHALFFRRRMVDKNVILGEVNCLIEAQRPLIEQFINDLYCVLRLLSNDPVASGSGAYQLVPGQQRPYQDVQAEVASRIATMGRYKARVKMTTDNGTFEYLIKTENPDPMIEKDGSIREPLTGKQLEKRLDTIQENNVAAGILRWWKDIDQEIRNRQVLLRDTGKAHSRSPENQKNDVGFTIERDY